MDLSLVIVGSVGFAASTATLVAVVWRWKKKHHSPVERKVIRVGEVQQKAEENLTLPGAADEKPDPVLLNSYGINSPEPEEKTEQLQRLMKWLKKERE